MVPDTGPGSGEYLLSYEGGVECPAAIRWEAGFPICCALNAPGPPSAPDAKAAVRRRP